jgi:hypothetical protein
MWTSTRVLFKEEWDVASIGAITYFAVSVVAIASAYHSEVLSAHGPAQAEPRIEPAFSP